MNTKHTPGPWIIAMVRSLPDGKTATSFFNSQMFGIPCFGQRDRALEFSTKAAAKAMTKHWRGKFEIRSAAIAKATNTSADL